MKTLDLPPRVIVIFRNAWYVGVNNNTLDDWGGPDCNRVFREWAEAGFPGPASDFIRRRANTIPGRCAVCFEPFRNEPEYQSPSGAVHFECRSMEQAIREWLPPDAQSVLNSLEVEFRKQKGGEDR